MHEVHGAGVPARRRSCRSGWTRRAAVVGLSAAALALAVGAPATGDVPDVPVAPGERPVSGEYVVTLQPGADLRSLTRSLGISPRFVYRAALPGFAARLSESQVAALQRRSAVAAIEQDQEVRAAQTRLIPAGSGLHGLDRIDQRSLPLSGTFSAADGAGVTAYVLDSGIATAHPDFGGRARNVYDAFGGDGQDCNGHGTHVAGTLGGRTHGVAGAVQLRGLRVLDCAGRGSVSAVLAAVEWLRTAVEPPAVANLSLSTGRSKALDAAVSRLVDAGVPTAVAAGNEDRNACRTSPAAADGVLTVAAVDETDARAGFSNHGSCVELYAPGVLVRSTSLAGATSGATSLDSGTSMASAHAAGVLALHVAADPTAPAATTTARLLTSSTTGVVRLDRTKTPDRLLFVDGP